jgi:predicted nucleotidyltransferase
MSTPQLFDASSRVEMLKRLLQIATESPDVFGTLLVGSGVDGFRDAYSDLDVVLVVAPDNYRTALVRLRQTIESGFRPVFQTIYEHRPDIYVICLLSENYLEIDIGVWSLASLFASSHRWNVVQQRDEEAAQQIVAAMQFNPRLTRTREALVTGDNPIWQHIYGRFIESKRSGEFDHKPKSTFDNAEIADVLSETYDLRQVRLLLPLIPKLPD